MKRIIKTGYDIQPIEDFRCDCGCEFLTNEYEECRNEEFGYDFIRDKCPWCGEIVESKVVRL